MKIDHRKSYYMTLDTETTNGFDDPIVYDFHHLDQKTKLFGIGSNSTTRSKQAYADEAKKCVLVCANCHRKIEKGLILQDTLNIIFDENKYFQTLEELVK